MKHWWVKAGLGIALNLVVINPGALPGNAQNVVTCTNCGTEWTQLLNKAMMAKQVATQAQQLGTQINQYKDMLINSKGLSTQVWGQAMQDFSKLQNLMSQSRSMAYSASNLDGQFSSKYGTYDAYLNRKMDAKDWQNKYAQWSQEGSDNARYALKGLGLQASQMQNEQALMQQLQSMAGSAEGRMQALQVANMMAAQNVEQVMKLRQMMMLQLQMQANYLAQQQDRMATQEAAHQRFMNAPRVRNDDGETF
jgi:P-type conjugative transfer protein TrbJ